MQHLRDIADSPVAESATRPQRLDAEAEVSAHIAEEAAEWLRRFDTGEATNLDASFAAWVTQSQEHLEEFLIATTVDRQLRCMGEDRLRDAVLRMKSQPSATEKALYDGTVSGDENRQEQLYFRYRRPLLQVFLQRKIPQDVAEDLLQRTFLEAIEKIRAEGLEDPSALGGYLYKTACYWASLYRRGELPRGRGTDTELLSNLQEGNLSLEERVDHGLLAKCVRTLMTHLPMARDREVLLRFYINEEPRESICRAMEMGDLQFNQVLWRARQRFGEILHRHGVLTD